MKAERVRVARQHLGCCEDERGLFLRQIGTDDETQAHPYNPKKQNTLYGISLQSITSAK
jgi:hypothetical protein